MKAFYATLNATLRSTFGTSVFRAKYIEQRKRLWEPVVITLALGMAVAVYGYGLYQVALAVAQAGDSLGQPEMVLGASLALIQTVVLFLSPFFVISAFYFANDLGLLLSLPLKTKTIVYAKFVSVLAGEYLTVLLLFVPSVAAYARFQRFGPTNALIAALVYLLTPVFPLAIASLLSLVLMRLVNRRHRDAYMVLMSVLALVVVLGFQFYVSRNAGVNQEMVLHDMVTQNLGLLRAVTRNFPPLIWAALAIHLWPDPRALIHLALLAVFALFWFWLLGAIGERLFLKGYLGSNEDSHDHARKKRKHPGVLSLPKNAFTALVQREWKLFFKTPIWWLNGFLPPIIIPFATILPLWGRPELDMLLGALRSEVFLLYAGLGFAAVWLFGGSLNSFAATSVSREGKHIWISGVIPHPVSVQINAKLLAAFFVTTLSTLPTLLVYIVVFRPHPVHLLMPVMLGLTGTMCAQIAGLTLDLLRPMLLWDHPQEPVKKNLNALFPMVVPLLFVTTGVLLVGFLLDHGVRALGVYSLMLLYFGIVGYVLYTILLRVARKGYLRFQD